jgi:hypothetical protein
MGKIIEFPSGKVVDEPREPKEILQDYLGECTEVAQHLILTMADEIDRLSEEDVTWLKGFDARDQEFAEARDFHVIVNLLHTALVRFLGVDHKLQKEADSLYIKLKAIELKQQLGEWDDDDTT